MQTMFGSGIMWGTQTQDAYGNAIAAAAQSPLLVGVLQDIAVDISGDIKELYGQNSFPFAAARGKMKVGIKAKAAQIYGLLWNNLFFGQNSGLNSGVIYNDVYTTTGMAVPATPYTITISSVAADATHIQIPNAGVTGSATILSVVNANGIPLQQVASAPAIGQYTFTKSTGAVVFASGDAGMSVYISYQYNATITGVSGTPGPLNQTVQNIPMGYAPTFQTDLSLNYNGKALTLTFFSCIASKLSFATKLDDFMVPEVDIAAFSNAAGQVFRWSISE